jgi:DNA repair protein RadC
MPSSSPCCCVRACAASACCSSRRTCFDAFGGLPGLLRAGPRELKRVKGLGGTAKRAEVAAVLELARRSVAAELSAKPVFDTPGKVKEYLALQLGARAHEVFAVLFLDAQSRLITLEEMFRGTLTQTSV